MPMFCMGGQADRHIDIPQPSLQDHGAHTSPKCRWRYLQLAFRWASSIDFVTSPPPAYCSISSSVTASTISTSASSESHADTSSICTASR